MSSTREVSHSEPKAAPATARGARTRAAIVAAARTVFERDGFVDARLTDITAAAQVATGSFYTYFANKDEVFQAVIEAAQEDLLHPGLPRIEGATTEAVIRATNRGYLEAYRRNAKLMLLLEQVAAVNPTFREVRLARSRAFAERNAKAIAQMQADGLADPELNPHVTSLALSGMVGRLAYHVFCAGHEATMDEMVETATRLWVNGLKLTT